MVLPAAAVTLLQYSPYIITAVEALYLMGEAVGKKYGYQVKEIHRQLREAPDRYARS